MKEKLLKELKDNADFIDNKKFGFISKYKGAAYYVRRGFGEYVQNNEKYKIWECKSNNKVFQINQEYKTAFTSLSVIKKIDELEKNNSQYAGVKKEAKQYIRRLMDACIRKGYQVPALRLLNAMVEGVIPSSQDEIKYYMIKIEANYARKSAYCDRGGYLQEFCLFDGKTDYKEGSENISKTIEHLREREVYDNFFMSAVATGKYGKQFKGDFFWQLRKVYNDVYISAKSNAMIADYAELDDATL